VPDGACAARFETGAEEERHGAYRPVFGVRDDARDVRRHLFGRETVCGGSVADVEADREEYVLVEWVERWLVRRVQVSEMRVGRCGMRGCVFGLLEERIVVQR
jgi:hypothetical protein